MVIQLNVLGYCKFIHQVLLTDAPIANSAVT